MSLSSTIKNIFNAALVLSVLFAYGVGSVATIEVEHNHEDEGTLTSSDHGHEHEHHHDHGDNDGSNNEENDNESEGDSHRHSHFIAFDMPPMFNSTNTQNVALAKCVTVRLTPECISCPEGP